MTTKINKNSFSREFNFESGIIIVAGPYNSGVKVSVLSKLFEKYKKDRKLKSLVFDGENINVPQYLETNKIADRDEIVEYGIEWYDGIHKDFDEIIKKFMNMGRTIFILNRPQLETIEEIKDFSKKVNNLKPLLINSKASLVILDVLEKVNATDNSKPILSVGDKDALHIDKRYVMEN